ncbi:hypothetical protein [Thermithiobacillus plumbiphilus]|uniref:Uncharacterized protein n=1 Tax=Thermithiobacillus plumbiphilus TaxID=1729899 RepID=A0ABU9D9E6_9PROT
MSTEERDDMVWKAILETAQDVAPQIPVEFLRKAYEIQRKHQFSQDSSESIHLMERLVDEQVGSSE